MTKDLETLAIMGAIAATAFILWRTYRNSTSLGKLAQKAPTIAPNGTPQLSDAGLNFLRPTASSLAKSYADTVDQDDADAGAALRAAYLSS